MNILYPVLIVLAISVVIGIGLCLADYFFNKNKNEVEEQIRDALPGANCGACGYSGCDAYANALANDNNTATNLCVPGGNDVAADIAKIMGVGALQAVKKTAHVFCDGCNHISENEFNYIGEHSCRMAKQLFDGYKLCKFGCLGFGDCVNACEYNALRMVDSIPQVSFEKCIACGKCEATCPNSIIRVTDFNIHKPYVNCSNTEKGAITRKECKSGCIGCKKCKKLCTANAIKVENNLAFIDHKLCTGCGKCADDCPAETINFICK